MKNARKNATDELQIIESVTADHLRQAVLLKSIQPFVSLSNEELALFFSAFRRQIIRKNEFWLQQGQVCESIGLLTSGVMIYMKNTDHGDELTTDFAFEGDWVNSVISRLKQEPSQLAIKAITDSELLVIKQADLSQLCLQIPKLERLVRIFTEQAFVKFAEQTMEFQIHTAKERYEHLLRTYPLVFTKVPLYHIANYLGIAPKSLSRIRRQLVQ